MNDRFFDPRAAASAARPDGGRSDGSAARTAAARSTGAGELPPPACAWVAFIAALAGLVWIIALVRFPAGPPLTLLVWIFASIIGQLLVFPTPTGQGRVTLSTTAHLAMVLVLGPAQFLTAIAIGRLGCAAFERKPWYRTLFNAAQVSIAVLAAWWIDRAVGTLVPAQGPGWLRQIPGFVAACAVYYGVNIGAVSIVIALASRRPVLEVWRQNFGYPLELLSTAGLAMLAPIAAAAWIALGGLGLVAFLLPLVFLREVSARYAALRRAHESMVRAERLAASARMAAEIGHDINNLLTLIQAQLQLLRRKKESVSAEELDRRLAMALEQLGAVDTLSRGLIDFTRKRTVVRPTALEPLLRDTCALLALQERFQKVRVRLSVDPGIGLVPVDPSQIQQVLINLFVNAVNAMEKSASPERSIVVGIRRLEDRVELSIEDTGPGVAPEIRDRIFEAGYTTHENGHGFGLFTVHSIVRNHRGEIRVETAAGGGARFRIELPLEVGASGPAPPANAEDLDRHLQNGPIQPESRVA